MEITIVVNNNNNNNNAIDLALFLLFQLSSYCFNSAGIVLLMTDNDSMVLSCCG